MHSSPASRKLNLRRVLATLLVALATVLACPAPSIAQTSPEGYEYEVELGGVVITGLPGASGKVEIPASIQGLPVEGIDDGAFEFNHAITEVVIPDSVTTIGERAFNDCTSLTNVTLPASLTSIGKSAFYSCSSLAQVDLPEGLTTLGDYAFFDCTSLTELTVPGSVRSLGTAAFSECEKLADVTIENGVTTIGERAFKECSSLTDFDLASSVTTIGRRAFEKCLCLGTIDLSHVTSIEGYAFSGCCLRDVDLSGCEFIGEKAFESQSGLDVEKLDLSCLKTIERHAFYGCFGGEYDPTDTSEGSTIELPACLESIAGGAFAGTGVAYLEVSENCAAYKDVDGAVYTADGSTLVTVAPKYAPAEDDEETFDVAEGATAIGAYAFEDVRYITYIDMPDTVTDLGEGAFYGAVGKLEEVTLSEGLTSIPNDTFHNCAIASITIPEGVTSIGDAAFANDGLDDNVNSNLKQMTVEGSLQSIGSYAFYNCKSLEKLELPASVTDLDASVFVGCKALADLSFAEGSPYTAENHSILADGGTTLVATYGIVGKDDESVTYEIPEGVTSVGKQALCGCPANRVNVPSTATTFGEQCIGYQYDGIGTVAWRSSIIAYGDKDNDGLIAYAKANYLCMLTGEPLANYPAAALSVGDTATFDFEAAPAELVSYASSNNYVATVDENGTISAVGGGEADIFACVGLESYPMHVTVDGPAAEDPYADYVKIDDQAEAEDFGTAYEQYNEGNYASSTTTPGLFLYTGNAYHAINAFLEPDQFKKIADGEYGVGEYGELEQVGKNVASEISQFKVHENVVVYSGCADDEFVLGNGGAKAMENVLNMVGKQVTFKPITSTSVLEGVAENFKRESTGNLVLEIYVPKDSTQGAYVGLHSMVQEEAELTLAPGTKLTVIDAGVRWYDDFGSKVAQRYMKLALVEDEDVDPEPDPEPEPEPEPEPDPTPEPEPTPDTPDEQPAGDGANEQDNDASDGTPATGDATVPVTGLAAAGLALLAISPRVRRD